MIDIDFLFDSYLDKFIEEEAEGLTEKEVEQKIAQLYLEFGDKKLTELGGLSPKEYFASKKSCELIDLLKECILSGVAVSDYFCTEIEKREDAKNLLLKTIIKCENDELCAYAVNLLDVRNFDEALVAYVDFIKNGSFSEGLLEAINEKLTENADSVKEIVLSAYKKGEASSKYFIEVLSFVKQKDDRVFQILMDEFKSCKGNVALFSAYIARYGDDRALPELYKKITENGLDYFDYVELKSAIESLGGEVDEEQVKEKRHFNKIIH